MLKNSKGGCIEIGYACDVCGRKKEVPRVDKLKEKFGIKKKLHICSPCMYAMALFDDEGVRTRYYWKKIENKEYSPEVEQTMRSEIKPELWGTKNLFDWCDQQGIKYITETITLETRRLTKEEKEDFVRMINERFNK
jgi:hypothetical protein